MNTNPKFLICKKCGNIINIIVHKCSAISCCGQMMTELVPNTVDASVEKHLPVYVVNDNTISVTVGSVVHPSEERHHISFICLHTSRGMQIKYITVPNVPTVEFSVNDQPIAVYAYCNLHGLWKSDIR